MREDTPKINIKPNNNFDQHQASRANTKLSSANPPKPKSWGSHIVKGFTSDKKTKLLSAASNNKKLPTVLEIPKHKTLNVSQPSRVKRSLIGDFPCSPNVAQVHPHVFDCQLVRSPASRDVLRELDHLRTLLQESKEREQLLHSDLLRHKDNSRLKELERELDIKRRENEKLVCELEAEKLSILDQLSSFLDHQEGALHCNAGSSVKAHQGKGSSKKNLEMEVVELRRLNKELQLQKRNLTLRLSSTESQLASLKNFSESDIVLKAEAEALKLRHTNEDLCKQVEGLQMSRLNEVEELAYLRWMNSCLRQELQNSDSQIGHSPCRSPFKVPKSPFINMTNKTSEQQKVSFTEVKHSNNEKKLPSWPKVDEHCQVIECDDILDREWMEANEGRSPGRRHSISGPRGCVEVFKLDKRRQSDGFFCPEDLETIRCPAVKGRLQTIAQKYEFGPVQSPRFLVNRTDLSKSSTFDIEKRALRIPNPPPKPSSSLPVVAKKDGTATVPPPPPPPPPPLPKFAPKNTNVMQRAPQVVELYHSLMKRDSRKDTSNAGVTDAPNVANVRSSMIGEIENRSSHLLAIKVDVETQGEFVRSLIQEVNNAAYRDIEDVVAFVKWLDDELSFLVDERAVLKHFEWPEKKADTLREAAFGYRDLKKLESEVTHYEDDLRIPSDIALKKMTALSEKMEHSVYSLIRTRDGLMRHCKGFQIPTDWMLDTGVISKIKIASVKLAKKYMKRVASELQTMEASIKDPALDYMLLQGVRFAFRIHQFAGGFDAETMHAFEELRNLAHVREKNSIEA